MEASNDRNESLATAISKRFGTQAAFAQALNVHERQVQRWIKGQRPYRLQREAICKELGVKPEKLGWPARAARGPNDL